MSEVVPFRALRYAPDIDLAAVICPPFDVISPAEQRALYQRSPHNAVRIELTEGGGDRYQRAAETLQLWRQEGSLRRDVSPAFYVYRQQFQHGGQTYARHMLFARLRLEEWDRGVVLPHEQTFGAPKEDRMQLLRATGLNASPVFLLYRDDKRLIAPHLADLTGAPPLAQFSDGGGEAQALWRIDNPDLTGALTQAFALERLYVADGHHRYETALAYRDERRAAAGTGDEPESFALVALTAAHDPGLLVLPIHRLAAAEIPLQELLSRLRGRFEVASMPSSSVLLTALAERGRTAPAFGLAAADSPDLYLVTPSDREAVDALLPQERSADWRGLDAAIATHAILRDGMGLDEAKMTDIRTVWFTEDAQDALGSVRGGRCRYALLLNPLPVRRILDIADAGERMPQKSTFFYPKVPTGLLFNSLHD